jgi:ABC-type methionine transport system ATPase subunit
MDDVSITVREVEPLGFPGISGAGKTTMIRLLTIVLYWNPALFPVQSRYPY